MQAGQCGTVPVVRAGRLVGLLSMENIGELIMVQNAVERRAAPAVPVIWPDIMARLRALYGTKIVTANAVLSTRDEERY